MRSYCPPFPPVECAGTSKQEVPCETFSTVAEQKIARRWLKTPLAKVLFQRSPEERFRPTYELERFIEDVNRSPKSEKMEEVRELAIIHHRHLIAMLIMLEKDSVLQYAKMLGKIGICYGQDVTPDFRLPRFPPKTRHHLRSIRVATAVCSRPK